MTALILANIALEALKGLIVVRWCIERKKTENGPMVWLATLVRGYTSLAFVHQGPIPRAASYI